MGLLCHESSRCVGCLVSTTKTSNLKSVARKIADVESNFNWGAVVGNLLEPFTTQFNGLQMLEKRHKPEMQPLSQVDVHRLASAHEFINTISLSPCCKGRDVFWSFVIFNSKSNEDIEDPWEAKRSEMVRVRV